MIQISNPILYQEALSCLKDHKQIIGRSFKGRFIQIFLGLKFFQNSLPSMYAGSFITTEVLQALLDDLYAKSSRQPNDCVLSLFEGNYLARTGIRAPGNKATQNTWRNNFNIQKGIGCYAPSSDLSSPTFLDQDRVICRHLLPIQPNSLDQAHCSLCPSGAYRRESHRKWLRIDPGGSGYAVTDLQNITNFEPYVAPSANRIPILPLIVALYHDADPGLVLGARTNVDLATFMADFNFSQSEISAYFDDTLQNRLNAQLANSAGWPAGASLGSQPQLLPSVIPPLAGRAPTKRTRSTTVPTAPVLTGTPVAPPATNSGWEAEQFVASALTADGWMTYVVSRQLLGYDIFAQKGAKKRYIEVKSSLGLCSPSLTNREWQQASFHSNSYVLSIVENFNPSGQNTIYWIPDPANRCIAIPQTTVLHSIPRSSWTSATIGIAAL